MVIDFPPAGAEEASSSLPSELTMATRGDRARRAVAACSVGLIAVLAACSARPDTAPARPASPASPADQRTTTAAPTRSTGTVAPLTGLAVTAAVAQRPAVAVPVSGPDPNGLGSADLVFEEMSSPVRYLAVFQSTEATSARWRPPGRWTARPCRCCTR